MTTVFDSGKKLPVSTSRFIIDGENIPFGAYQAIYHKITKKTERITQNYEHAYEITLSDIKELHQRLDQAIQQYRVAGKECEISHSLNQGQSRQYSSFEKFEISDVSTRCTSSSVVYELNFLVILPAEIPEAEEIPQRYKLTLQVRNDLDEQADNSIPHFINFGFIDVPISLTLEYADYAVVLALKSIADKWVESLPTRKRTKVSNFVSRNRIFLGRHVAGISATLPFLTATIFLIGAGDLSAVKTGVVLAAALMLCYLTASLLSLFVSNIETLSDELAPKNYLLITQGDHSEKVKLDKSRRKLVALFGFLLASALSIGLNIYSSAVYAWLIS